MLATRQPRWSSSSLQCISQTWRILFFFQANGGLLLLCNRDDTDMRYRKTDEIGSDERFLCFCFACEMDGAFGMQEGACFG